LLSGGRIIQMGTPDEVYHHPADLSVASFFGLNNQVTGTVAQTGVNVLVKTPIGEFRITNEPTLENDMQEGENVTLILRQARIESRSLDSVNSIQGIVIESRFTAAGYQTKVQLSKVCMEFLLEKPMLPGQTIHLYIRPEDISLLHGNPE